MTNEIEFPELTPSVKRICSQPGVCLSSEHLDKFAEALAEAKTRMKVAKQSGRNPFFKSDKSRDGSRYSTMQDVDAAISEALCSAGFAPVTVQPMREAGEWMAYGALRHKSGQFIAGYLPLLNPKGDMQGLKSALTYAQRMLTLMLAGGISGDDDDGNGTRPDTEGKEIIAMKELDKAIHAKDEDAARKTLGLIKLRETERKLPKGAGARAAKRFQTAFAKE